MFQYSCTTGSSSLLLNGFCRKYEALVLHTIIISIQILYNCCKLRYKAFSEMRKFSEIQMEFVKVCITLDTIFHHYIRQYIDRTAAYYITYMPYRQALVLWITYLKPYRVIWLKIVCDHCYFEMLNTTEIHDLNIFIVFQMHLLDNLSTEDFLKRNFKWVPLIEK